MGGIEDHIGRGIVLSLCDRTGIMVLPWLDAGYSALTVDLQPAANPHPRRFHIIDDVIEWRYPEYLPSPVIVFAFPLCSDLAVSGARWMKAKGLTALITALQLVDACRQNCEKSGAPYMIENPIGTLSTYWRYPDFIFDPCDYGDPYTKATCLWTGNGFVMPPCVRPGDMFDAPTWVEPTEGSMILNFSPSPDRADNRSITPPGFSAAVFDANGRR